MANNPVSYRDPTGYGITIRGNRVSSIPSPVPRGGRRVADPNISTGNLSSTTRDAGKSRKLPSIIVDLEVDEVTQVNRRVERSGSAVAENSSLPRPLPSNEVGDNLEKAPLMPPTLNRFSSGPAGAGRTLSRDSKITDNEIELFDPINKLHKFTAKLNDSGGVEIDVSLVDLQDKRWKMVGSGQGMYLRMFDHFGRDNIKYWHGQFIRDNLKAVREAMSLGLSAKEAVLRTKSARLWEPMFQERGIVSIDAGDGGLPHLGMFFFEVKLGPPK
jgi:hypothetical protein